MADVLFTVEALDASDVSVTLRFSLGGYKDDDGVFYLPRIANAPLLTVAPNDGGLLPVFNAQGVTESIGDVALNNIDGELDTLADYAVDGRTATVARVSNGVVTTGFVGTVDHMYDDNGLLIFVLKSRHETLNDNHPMAIYAGDNILPAGLEGTEEDIKGNVKPLVFGDCRNISPKLVNSSLLIYQASSLANCRITAVYDDGVRLTNYLVNGVHAVNETVIAVDTGIGGLGSASQVVFANHSHVYGLAAGLSSGHITLAEGLLVAVPDNTPIEFVDFYSSDTALQATDYFIANDLAVGAKSIVVSGGVGSINVGDQVIFASHLAIYTVATALAAGVFSLDDGLIVEVSAGDVLHVLNAATPTLWGSFQGYFRLTAKPAGTITCDAVALNDEGAIQKAGEVFASIADARGFTVDVDNQGVFNAVGTVGVYVDSQTTTAELLNKIALSVAGFYYCTGYDITLALLSVPASSPDWVLYDYQIDSISRSATGLGKNGIPFYETVVTYDRIETVQDSITGFVSSRWRQRLKTQTRKKSLSDTVVKTRHLLAGVLTIDSLLRTASDVGVLLTRVMPLVKVSRHIITIVVPTEQAPPLVINSTGHIVTPRRGYAAGRNFVLASYELDDDNHTVTLRLFG